jgi:hypothetical protein
MRGVLSIADLRRITGKPSHVINHALLRYGPEPIGRIGIARIWRREDLPKIEESLRRTAENRTRREPQREVVGE